MRTSKAIATISYNSDEFLIRKLSDMIDKGKIDFFAFINHLPEEDEKKVHKHLFIVPACLVDTNIINKELEEITTLNDIPLKCMPFRNSKFSDWYLYALHDKDYLASKLDSKKYHYDESDVYASDATYFQDLINTSDFTRYRCQKIFMSMVESNLSWSSIVKSGIIPPNLMSQYKVMYDALMYADGIDRVDGAKADSVVRDVMFKSRFGRL